VIEVSGLTRSFVLGNRQIDVLRGIDFSMQEGERVAVTGASGAGKTTFMHILGGLDRPSTGSVRFQGEDIFALRGGALDSFRNRTVGFVFQFHQLLPEFTAIENVMMPSLIAGHSRQKAFDAASQLLEEVGLSHRFSHKPGELSGGEQQRVAIARALVMSPLFLLADEPTGNLDSHTSDEIYNLLDALHKGRGLTMLLVTHSHSLASRLDRVVHMEDGVFVGT